MARKKYLKPRVNKVMPWLLLILVLTMVAAALSWNAQSRYQEFIQYQRSLMQSSVNGASAQLEIFIGELRRSVHLFADTESDRLKRLAANPGDQEILEQLNTATRKHFPEAFAFTVASTEGKPLLTDFDGLIGEVCLLDMQTFASDKQHSKIYVHPHPLAYHFDIMVDWENHNNPNGIFFVSFEVKLLSRLLKHAQLPGHELMLIKRNVPGLIEMTADGARINLQRSFKLNDDEISRIGYTAAVNGTLWDLVNLVNSDLYSGMLLQLWKEMILIMLVFTLVLSIMVWLYQRIQHRRLLLEHACSHDAITDLPNRSLFMQTLERLINNKRQPHKVFTLLLLDTGQVRRLKGTFFEHRASDLLIREIAERVTTLFNDAIIVARIDNNNYAALVPFSDSKKINARVNKIMAEMKKAFGDQLDLILKNTCVGYAQFPEDGQDGATLIRHAGKQIYSMREMKRC